MIEYACPWIWITAEPSIFPDLKQRWEGSRIENRLQDGVGALHRFNDVRR